MDKSREEISKEAYELGFHYEQEYGGCCQCALAAIQDALGMENKAVFKSATGLSGGLCSTGDGACGALTAGVMAIGCKIGRERDNFKDPEENRLKTRELGLKLYNKFIKEYGSGNCREIQKKLFGRSYNLLDTSEREEFEKAGAHTEKCPSVAGNAAMWTVEILLEQ